jgi:hypothetical protein
LSEEVSQEPEQRETARSEASRYFWSRDTTWPQEPQAEIMDFSIVEPDMP